MSHPPITEEAAELDRVDAFDFDLPQELIAHAPPERRGESRLLVCPPEGPMEVSSFASMRQRLSPGDLLVINDTRVVPCRVFGQKPTGGAVEVFVLGPRAPSRWDSPLSGEGVAVDALVRANRSPKPGTPLSLHTGEAHEATAEVLARSDDGVFRLRIRGGGTLEGLLTQAGQMPLPPYIVRRRKSLGLPEASPQDAERYQTVYAAEPGAVAAPTAGLHFTDELLSALRERGVEVGTLTLHVGIGTFRPLDERPLSAQTLHEEPYTISTELAGQVERTTRRGGRVVAVGTTSVRALEDQARRLGRRAVEPGAWATDIFIRPGHRFGLVDGIITNFHLPRSSLIVLVAAFAGYERTRAAYARAIQDEMRFYSYGDAMFLPGPQP